MDTMPSLIVKFAEGEVQRISLPQGDLSIGRRPGHALVLDDSAVSADHASIFTVGKDSFLKDLDSTNGTFINNKRIRKHHLKNGDRIAIGKHVIIYGLEDEVTDPLVPADIGVDAALFILSGFNSGKRIDLKANITHLGKTGRPAALLSRTGDRFTLMVTPNTTPVLLNGKPVSPGGAILESGDLLEVGDTRLQFYQR